MNTQRRDQLLSMLRNALSVLAAILVAFALDAWWGDRVEVRRTSALLAAVGSEFDQAVVQLDSVIAENDAAIEAGHAFLERSRPGPAGAPAPVGTLIEYAAAAGAGQTYEPSFGALATLLSGGLEDVSDLELQRSLADWPGRLDELDFEVQLLQSAFRQLFEAYASVGPLMPRPYVHAADSTREEIDPRSIDDLRTAIWVLAAGLEAYTEELRVLRGEAAELARLLTARN